MEKLLNKDDVRATAKACEALMGGMNAWGKSKTLEYLIGVMLPDLVAAHLVPKSNGDLSQIKSIVEGDEKITMGIINQVLNDLNKEVLVVLEGPDQEIGLHILTRAALNPLKELLIVIKEGLEDAA